MGRLCRARVARWKLRVLWEVSGAPGATEAAWAAPKAKVLASPRACVDCAAPLSGGDDGGTVAGRAGKAGARREIIHALAMRPRLGRSGGWPPPATLRCSGTLCRPAAPQVQKRGPPWRRDDSGHDGPRNCPRAGAAPARRRPDNCRRRRPQGNAGRPRRRVRWRPPTSRVVHVAAGIRMTSALGGLGARGAGGCDRRDGPGWSVTCRLRRRWR